MTTQGEPQMWSEQFPLGEPQTISQDHQCLRYTGEVIRAERWSPTWGEPLEGDIHFRIVLLTQRQTGPEPLLRDARIALGLLGSGVPRQCNRLVRESATNQEMLGQHTYRRDEQSELIRRSLRQRQEELDQEILALDSSRYTTGRLLAGPENISYPMDYLSGSDPVSWFARIAQRLLTDAYPDSPVGGLAPLPRPVSPEDIGQLYGGVMNQRGAPAQLLAELGPGLGLSTADQPETFDTSRCAVFDAIRTQLAEEPLPVAWPELHQHLSHQIGLTGPLATLYLLTFLQRERPELELVLAPEHEIKLTGPLPFLGHRLTGDLLPRVEWDHRLSQWIARIESTAPPGWRDALPYLSALCPDLPPEDQAQGETLLRETLQQLGQSVARFRDCWQTLARAGLEYSLDSRDDTDSAKTRESTESRESRGTLLDRLSGLAGSDYLTIYQSLRWAYSKPGQLPKQLEEDRANLTLLERLTPHTDTLTEAWSYLQRAAVPASRSQLSQLFIERQSVQGAVFQSTLLYLAQNWEARRHQFSQFKANYAAAYREHHEDQRQALAEYRRNYAEAQLKLRALELLNTLEELGEPTGPGLAEGLETLTPQLATCSIQPQDLNLDQEAQCSSCLVSLERSLPQSGLAHQLAEIDATLTEKNRTLSGLVVERIIDRPENALRVSLRVQQFLAVIQASDLSALSNTINPDLVAFIQNMLKR